MESETFVAQLNEHISHLFSFAKQINELDFAASLGGEFRGAQDAGWTTTITAHQVFDEISALSERRNPISTADFRVMLMLYCQLSESGGVYESLKNIMGVVSLKPYILWPFQDLVRIKRAPKRVIGPNANATFRDLATTARSIGLSRLSLLLENAFRDDIRNGISHADYVIWDDGLRLRNRNGGYVNKISFEDVNAALTKGIGFFQILREYNGAAVRSYEPAKEIVGRLSANFPMPWTVSWKREDGTFQISSSAPGSMTTPAYNRQTNINCRLGGKVFATYSTEPGDGSKEIAKYIDQEGFEPNNVVMEAGQLAALIDDVDNMDLWDNRHPSARTGELLIASPWGFRWLTVPSDFSSILEIPFLEFDLSTFTAS